jgi:hypothetical protein
VWHGKECVVQLPHSSSTTAILFLHHPSSAPFPRCSTLSWTRVQERVGFKSFSLSSSQPAFLRPTPSAYGASHRLRPKVVAFTTRIFQVISKGRRGHPYSAHRLLYDCQRNVLWTSCLNPHFSHYAGPFQAKSLTRTMIELQECRSKTSFRRSLVRFFFIFVPFFTH